MSWVLIFEIYIKYRCVVYAYNYIRWGGRER